MPGLNMKINGIESDSRIAGVGEQGVGDRVLWSCRTMIGDPMDACL